MYLISLRRGSEFLQLKLTDEPIKVVLSKKKKKKEKEKKGGVSICYAYRSFFNSDSALKILY